MERLLRHILAQPSPVIFDLVPRALAMMEQAVGRILMVEVLEAQNLHVKKRILSWVAKETAFSTTLGVRQDLNLKDAVYVSQVEELGLRQLCSNGIIARILLHKRLTACVTRCARRDLNPTKRG